MCLPLYENISGKGCRLTYTLWREAKVAKNSTSQLSSTQKGWGREERWEVQKETGLGLFSEQGDGCERVSGLSRVLQITLACSEQSKGWSADLGVRVPGSNTFKRLV